MNKKALVPFLSRLAILCNASFLISLAVMYLSSFHLPDFLANFFAVLGLEMAPFLNIVLLGMFVFYWVKKEPITIPKWQTIVNILMLLLQLTTLFF
jgi:hypothetical protein